MSQISEVLREVSPELVQIFLLLCAALVLLFFFGRDAFANAVASAKRDAIQAQIAEAKKKLETQ